ncbi:hypothetical protein [Rummeliibacillus stabekisii]|uniref:hypothetical protein n=1 Tax=Rummeliibacillus stabekisii TaxID=241244 RepID=UPI0037132CD5
MKAERDIDFKNYVHVLDEGLEVIYKEVEFRKIERLVGTVNGYDFYKNHRNGYWMKRGSGSVKNRQAIEDRLRASDSYIVEHGFNFLEEGF